MSLIAVLEIIGVLAAVVVVLALPVIFVVLRVRWLTRMGGSFECSLLLDASSPGSGWALGVARYVGEDLEWFRYYAVALRPRVRIYRQAASVLETRDPDPLEAMTLYSGHRIVELESYDATGNHHRQLAMSTQSLTGLMSWLEAAPPGQVPRSAQSPESAV